MTAGALRRVALTLVRDHVVRVWAREKKQQARSENAAYHQGHGYELPEGREQTDLAQQIHHQADILTEEFPQHAALAEQSRRYARQLADAGIDIRTQWENLQAFLRGCAETEIISHTGPGLAQLSLRNGQVTVRLGSSEQTRAQALPAGAPQYLRAVSQLLSAARGEGRALTHAEQIAVQVAYFLLDQGARIDEDFQLWGAAGFRTRQTYLSITDPGEGHVLGSTLREAHLDGTVVHVEHIERAESEDREACEPYRLPSIRTIARVRLHTGVRAPISVYVGRPMFEGDFETSLVKSVRFMAAACSTLFQAGVAECKISMEHMTARQAVRFMRAVAADTLMNPHRQLLSAAFNLNDPFTDDRDQDKPSRITDRLALGRLGIDLTRQGGFAKVAWDGAGDSHPSDPVIVQLGHRTASTLVHEAHTAGLLTYMSAGISFDNLADVVHTGVDAVGIGSALHYKDSDTGFHGPFIEERITRLRTLRDEGEASVQGRAARLLARLDRMHFEGSLRAADAGPREELANAVTGRGARTNEAQLAELLGRLAHIAAMPDDSRHPYLTSAARILHAGEQSLAARRCAGPWDEQAALLQELIDREDLDELHTRLREFAPDATAHTTI
ncbi:hypothetical protein [Streptomyces sp. NPDC050264]|uniref:hypothetical protein n=1 Tax=Streptomyces sp. NPDC050264 TaxID=3155038 RepID=UPI0034353CEC